MYASESNKSKLYKRASFIIIATLLIWKMLLFYYFPFPNTDGPWGLSQTFSIIRGHFFASTFAHSFMGFYNLPYMLGLLNAPFYAVFTHTSFLVYSIFFWNLVWVLLTLVLAYRMLQKAGDDGLRFLLFAIAFLLSSYTYSLRSEIFILPFLLLLQQALDSFKTTNKYGWLAALLAAIIGLIHPVGGFYAVFFIVVFCWDNQISIKRTAGLLTGVAAGVLVLYGPVIFINIDLWRLNFFQRGFENDTRHFDITYPVKFFSYSLPLFALLVYYLAASKQIVKEILYLISCIALLLLFERSYYLPYLFHLIFWRITVNRNYLINGFMKVLFSVTFICGLFVCYIWPSYQLKENKKYAQTFKQNLAFAQQITDKNPGKLIWVPSNMAMKVIDRPNARLYIPYYANLLGTAPAFDTSSIYIVESKADKDIISSYKVGENDSLAINQIHPPIKGLRKMGLQAERSDSLGLWMIKEVKKLN